MEMGFKVGSQTCKRSGLGLLQATTGEDEKGCGGKAEGMPVIQCGGGTETETEARLRLLLTSSSSVDVEVCAASEHVSPMSLFQFECDNETPTLQLRSANGCYLAQVRL